MGAQKVRDFFIDPRGETVTLYEQTWNTHIAEGHPEMRQRYEDLRATLENPDRIRQGRNPKTEELYIKQCAVDHTFVSTRLIDQDLKIVTSFYAGPDRPSRGQIIWPESLKQR